MSPFQRPPQAGSKAGVHKAGTDNAQEWPGLWGTGEHCPHPDASPREVGPRWPGLLEKPGILTYEKSYPF